MAGEFLGRGAIIATTKDVHRTIGIERRQGMGRESPGPNREAWLAIETGRTILDAEQAVECRAAEK